MALTGCLLLVIFVIIYFFSHRYTEQEFYERLQERATISAQATLEKDELSASIYNEIRGKHLQILPDEQERIFRVNINRQEILKEYEGRLPESFFQEIFETGFHTARIGETFFAGILYRDNEGDFIVVSSARHPYGKAKMVNLRNILIVAFGLSLIIIYILGQYYARQVLRPISNINQKVNEIKASNLHLRLDTGNNKDELAELAITFNNMLDRLEASFEIQNNFISNASHELRNPLTVILGETEVALRKARPQEAYRNSLNVVQKEASRLDLLVNSLLRLAQTDFDQKGFAMEQVRIDELLIGLKNSFDQTHPDNQVKVDLSQLPEQQEALVVYGNESLLRLAFSNIIDNAIKFSSNREVDVLIKAGGDTVSVNVRDRGMGIPAGEIDKIMEPFYRASNARGYQGFGVGLPLTQRIVKILGGSINIKAPEDGGTLVEMVLPQGPDN